LQTLKPEQIIEFENFTKAFNEAKQGGDEGGIEHKEIT
jgi:hypothetical protein